MGFFLVWFPKGLKPWKAMFIGVAMAFVPTSWLLVILLLRLRYDESFYIIGIFFFIYALSGFLAWLINKSVLDYVRRKTVFPSDINRELVVQIWEAKKKWQVNRFDIDKELLGRGYPETEIETVWQIIQDGRVVEDDDGDLVVKTFQTRPVFLDWRQITLCLFIIHLAGIFFTPLFYLPALFVTVAVFLLQRRKISTPIKI
jgi:hypothetical protein